jgi:heterodisulfide reductase subunit C
MIEVDAVFQLQSGLAGFNWDQCNQCGKCSSGCPAARYLDLRPRRIVAMTQRDLVAEILESNVVWMCAQCLQCVERCPSDVTPYDIIISLQNRAVREGLFYPEGLTKMLASVKRLGAIQPPMEIVDREFEIHDRESLDLPEIRRPKALDKFVEALEKVMEGS